MHTVSCSFSLPARGSFHLSITVLVHYRSLTVFSLTKMVLVDSHGISRAPCYSGATKVSFYFVYRTITVSGQAFQLCSTIKTDPILWSYNTLKGFGLIPVRSPLLRKSLICFLFHRLLRCFSSAGSLLLSYVFR